LTAAKVCQLATTTECARASHAEIASHVASRLWQRCSVLAFCADSRIGEAREIDALMDVKGRVGGAGRPVMSHSS
jgi:hypothetical protein